MDTLLSYHPGDLLLFSPRVYWALVAGANERYWPMALLSPLAGLWLLWTLARPHQTRRRVSLVLTGCAWLFVTWSFLWGEYRSINWAVTWAIGPFILQGLLLLVLAGKARLLSSPAPHRHLAAIILVAWGTLIHPLGFLLDDRTLIEADSWLLFPDPVAITTLGIVLAIARGPWLALALPIPLLWSVIGGATLLGLGSPIGWGMLCGAVLAMAGWLPLTRARS
ncbi:DUF6064 family protein [Marinobacter sp.]|uniref:DUF6064 family protein n=1 Tax=Marinobacter sp. TaxID=50741 RepID=UPI00356B0920